MTRFLSFVILCISALAANAQICKISGENDTVEIFSSEFSNDNKAVIVTVANDSEDKYVNVTVQIEVTYGNKKTAIYTGKGQAAPHSTTILPEIAIDRYWGNTTYAPVSVKAISISGSKCM